MKTKLPELEIPGPEGWKITLDTPPNIAATATHKSFQAEPKERLVVDYATWEKYRNRLIEVVYPAEVVGANITWWWEPDNEKWTPSRVNVRVRLLNPRTMEPYAFTNPMSAIRYVHAEMFSGDSDEIPNSRENLERVLLEATKPKTKITVTITEEPIDG